MGNIYNLLEQDFRFKDALNACMNCGICTAICPAAEFFDYDPRKICDTVQRKNEDELEKLLRSVTIWECGQCLSCKTRCPRGNIPGEVISVLRSVSEQLGYFNDEIREQQQRLMNTVGANILEIGYCVHPDRVDPELHPEQGPIWEWYIQNIKEIAPKLGANYHGDGPGALRTIHKKNLDEINEIYKVTGGLDLIDKVLKNE